jgi:hypothetical protein
LKETLNYLQLSRGAGSVEGVAFARQYVNLDVPVLEEDLEYCDD